MQREKNIILIIVSIKYFGTVDSGTYYVGHGSGN